jgi:FkbM family methyltransferase
MKILFVLKQMLFVRHFDTVVRLLADRGHEVRLACQNDELDLPPILSNHPQISAVACPSKRDDDWHVPAAIVRRSRDYLRYLEPEFVRAAALRERAFETLVQTVSAKTRIPEPGWAEIGLQLNAHERERLRTTLRMVEDVVPTSAGFDGVLAAERPDLLLVTPLILLGSLQYEYLKSAKAMGIPSGLPVFSWDNLTNKGVLQVLPDAVFVWNEIQRRESIELHGVPPDRVVVTGAPRFDEFFAMRPSADRAFFCDRLGLDPGAATLTYLCSSPVVTPREVEFVERWLQAIRGAPDAHLAGANVIIRPHPRHFTQWKGFESRQHEKVAVSISKIANSDQSLYDCLYHCEAAVGLNTSAQLEAAILGKPVYTLLVPEFTDGQQNTLHFHYLLREHGGSVVVARSLAEHVAHLSAALAGDYDSGSITRFVESFLRPAGLTLPAAPIMADAIEAFARSAIRPARPRRSWWGGLYDRWRDGAPVTPAGATRPRPPAPATSLAAAGSGSQPPVKGRRDKPTRDAEKPAPVPPELLEERARASGLVPDKKKVKSVFRLDYARFPIFIYATSPPERNWRVNTCAKEPWTIKWLEETLRPGDVFYDVGANVGALSLIAAKLCSPGHVVAFEPGFASFARLCDNLVLNGVSNVVPIPLPLAEATALKSFTYKTLHPGQSRHTLAAAGAAPEVLRAASVPFAQPVLAMRLDDVERQFALPRPTHMKIDVDGGELGVLQGAGETLQSPGLKGILIEVAPGLTDAVCDVLARAGFALVSRYDRSESGEHATDSWYGVFRRS